MSIVDILIPSFMVICICFVCYRVKMMITSHTRQLPMMDVLKYTVTYKRTDAGGDGKDSSIIYSVDCIDKENNSTNLVVSKKIYNKIEKDDNIIVIYKNGKLSDIGKE